MILQGSFNTTSSGVQYSSFQGIRYAESPTGSRRYHPLTTCSQLFHRFLAPEPHQPEEGLWDVSSESTIMCPQKSSWYDPWHVVGQEDCLFLNVYVPETEEQAPLPVMVWIHGGALLAGAGTFQEHGPQHLLDKWDYRRRVFQTFSSGTWLWSQSTTGLVRSAFFALAQTW